MGVWGMSVGSGYEYNQGREYKTAEFDPPPIPDPVPPRLGNPQPHRWTLLRELSVGKACVVMLNYPDCVNYEGKKILVYKASSFAEVRKKNNDLVDPHFFPGNERYSPVARFEPTEHGWQLALKLAELLN